MVRIHAKYGDGSDQKEFLLECSSAARVDEITLELARISNFQSKINALAQDLEPRLAPLHENPKGLFFYLYAQKNSFSFSFYSRS